MISSKRLKVLFVTSELFPFVKTGGLADVSAALPLMLSELGHEVRILVPKYGAIDNRRYKIHDVVRLKDLSVQIGEKQVLFSLKSSFLPSQKVRVQIYFLDNPEYFGSRKSLYSDLLSGEEYPDNDERFMLLSKAVFELISKLGWVPDIIHCNDWQTGLTPAFLKSVYKDEAKTEPFKVLYTVHNFASPGIFPKSTFKKTGLPEKMFSESGLLHDGKFNFIKAGIVYSDCVNTVSEEYAKEVMKDKTISGGLNAVLAKRKNNFFGLVNGIDVNVWNPEKDKFIPKNYSIKSIQDKVINKKALAERFGLKFDENIPIIGIITRLTEVKGVDLIVSAFEKLMSMNLQIILLGAGDKKLQTAIQKLSQKYSDKFASYIGFNDELAHLIEAGSDMFLMPSKYEPCGLNQLYSLVYGTIPIVRKTGGLADTVSKFDPETGEGTGFVFEKFSAPEMLKTIKEAVEMFQNKKVWQKIMKNGMKSDFSWQSSAKKYIELYKTVLDS